jgi:hypothetical protein
VQGGAQGQPSHKVVLLLSQLAKTLVYVKIGAQVSGKAQKKLPMTGLAFGDGMIELGQFRVLHMSGDQAKTLSSTAFNNGSYQ